MLWGVAIRYADKSAIEEYTSVENCVSFEKCNLFEIESGGERYYIAASFVKVFENELEFHETSLGYENLDRQKEIAGGG